MAYTVSVTVNRAEVYALLAERVGKIGQKVREVSQRRVPKRTGRLMASLHVIVGDAPGFVYADIGTHLSYGYWRHQGTGLYAGHGLIRPTTSTVMRFVPGRPSGPLRGSGKFVRGPRKPSVYAYARTVKGQPGSPYLTSALADVVGGDGVIRKFT
jgi:hypothetical protein